MAKDYWLTPLIEIIDGYAWGVLPDGKTVCYGTEEDVKKKLAKKGSGETLEVPPQPTG